MNNQTSVPRVTLDAIEANIVSEYFFTASQGVAGRCHVLGTPTFVHEMSLDLLTFCVLVLKNGFVVTGECVNPKCFDGEIGKSRARENAIGKVWSLMSYQQCSDLSNWSSVTPIY